MLNRSILNPILENESLTRGLSDPEARVLIEWLVSQTEDWSETLDEDNLPGLVEYLCQRARRISRFVTLWTNPQTRGAACQLAATERFCWPLPTKDIDPVELMLEILVYEEDGNQNRAAA